jgi:hypothetical protein
MAATRRHLPVPRKHRTEGDIKPEVKHALERIGCWVIPTPAGKPFGCWGLEVAPEGWTDLLVLIPPGLVGFGELKRPGGKRSPKQRATHALLERNGYLVATWESAREAVETVQEWRALDKARRNR